uniref:TF-B3 domain-containing protein n=1 Tax=Lactuca sativa TaxID=4236 RepID=A0A9R1UIA3_LACSA|nr:hypothetical protein LSAT_V11C900460070 [Lactuca sativa]
MGIDRVTTRSTPGNNFLRRQSPQRHWKTEPVSDTKAACRKALPVANRKHFQRCSFTFRRHRDESMEISSQSYILTKGWSRFVKEKNLKAGETVSFQRSTSSDKQLYIDWKTKNGSGRSNIQEQATLQHVQEW